MQLILIVERRKVSDEAEQDEHETRNQKKACISEVCVILMSFILFCFLRLKFIKSTIYLFQFYTLKKID